MGKPETACFFFFLWTVSPSLLRTMLGITHQKEKREANTWSIVRDGCVGQISYSLCGNAVKHCWSSSAALEMFSAWGVTDLQFSAHILWFLTGFSFHLMVTTVDIQEKKTHFFLLRSIFSLPLLEYPLFLIRLAGITRKVIITGG